MNYSQSLPNTNTYSQPIMPGMPQMNQMPGMPQMNPMTGMPQMNPMTGMTQINPLGPQRPGIMQNPYQNPGYGGGYPMQSYGQNAPNINFSVPHSQNPNLNYSMNFGINSNSENSSVDFNPYDRNVNYLNQNRSMGNAYQGMYNMTNYMNGIQPKTSMNPLNVSQREIDNFAFLANRNQEKILMKDQTDMIKQNIQDDVETYETREERQKKALLKYRGFLNKPPIEVYIPKSQYFNDRDRYFLEQLIMKPLMTNGILGTRLVTDFDKSALFEDRFEIRNNFKRDNEDEYFENSIKDGIYLDYIKQIIYSYNIQKIEQRAAREGKKEWFRSNGDLRMDHDIFSDVITKPIDITLSPNESFSTYYSNNSLSGRDTTRIKKVYTLKILIAKLILKYHPFFSEEDILANEVKELHKEYYYHMNQLNIPYYKNKIRTISERMDEYSKLKDITPDIEIEKKNMSFFLTETATFLEEEKRVLNNKANQLYSKWLELKKLRETQKFQSTKLKLNVLRFRCNQENPNLFDYAFVLSNTNISEDLTLIPKTEVNRRAYSRNLKCQLKIYINGVETCLTKHVNVQWPSYETDFNIQYILKMMTRPTKMEFELFINEKSINRFEAEPPGIFSKTVTSSASLFEEVTFGKIVEDTKKDSSQLSGNNTLNDINANNNNKEDENEKLLQENDKNKDKVNEAEKLRIRQIEGSLIIKTEWEGRAPDLPPTKIENKLELVNKQQDFQEKIKKYNPYYYPYDVNDPRNVARFEEMKKERLGLMLKFFYKEYLFTYSNVESLRHYLLLKRVEKESLSQIHFPILEHEIESDPKMKRQIDELKERDMRLKIIDTKQEMDNKLKAIDDEYAKQSRDEKTYFKMLSDKIKIMKKDEQQQTNMGYFQVLSEAELYTSPALLCSEFFTRVFTTARKLAPLRMKPQTVKVEKTESMKINIHVIKAMNVPVRNQAHPTKTVDYLKLESVNLRTTRNVLVKNQEANQMNYYGTMNNSNVMNNSYTNNNSFAIGGMIEPNNMAYPQGSMGSNPNINNQMFNPNNPGRVLMYDPNLIGTNAVDSLTKIQYLAQYEKKVNTFIQVKIKYYDQEGVMRTDSVDSIHPDYNYQFEFTIKPKDYDKNNDENKKVFFTREELFKSPGEFYFTLYDEIKKEKMVKEKDATTYVQRYEKKYLGSFSIPFATVFQNASILDTVCKVNIPQTVFGYYSDSSSVLDKSETEKIKQQNEGKIEDQRVGIEKLVPNNNYGDEFPDDSNIVRVVDPFQNTYVSLYITLDPIPNFTKADDVDYSAGFEDSIFLINSTKWLKKIKSQALLKDRHIKIFAENFDHKSTFIPRFIKPGGQKPPPNFFNPLFDNNIELAARYVALIPFVEDSQSWDSSVEMPDCWCTDNRFLTLGFGDYEEHAILLLNYLNYIDSNTTQMCESFLVLGDAHPEGMTTYVMRKTKDNIAKKEVEFWNAKTGDCFHFDKTIEKNNFLCFTVNKTYKLSQSNKDSICQLKSIGAIVSSDNIYVNIQKVSDPGLMDFDLSNKKNWLPFLTEESRKKYFHKGLDTVQQNIEYKETTEEKEKDAVNKIEEDIKRYLKEKISTERAEYKFSQKPLTTVFNDTKYDRIKLILKNYEQFCRDTMKTGIKLQPNADPNQNQNQNPNQYMNQNMNINPNINQNIKYEAYRNAKLMQLQDYQNEIKALFNVREMINQRNEKYDFPEIYGFPINLSYTSNDKIWEQVKLTEVHLAANENCTFTLTVYVEAYPSEIYSVWIFLAIINENRGL